jgi:large subunit ribosomal protein L25
MAGEIPDLIAEARAGTGKGAARQARREGKVPGIVYGGGADPQPIQIPFNQLLKRLKDGRFLSTLFNLKVEGQEDVRVICRGVQRDVVKDLPTHVDLMRLRRTSKVNLFIPVEFVNQEAAPGLKRGGVLTVVRPEVELIVVAGEIPDHITADLSGREHRRRDPHLGHPAARRREADDRPRLRRCQHHGAVRPRELRQRGGREADDGEEAGAED